MRLIEGIQLLLVASSIVLCAQSARLYMSSKLKVSLFFSLLFLLIALLNLTSLATRFINLPGPTAQVILTVLSLLCLLYVAYVELKNSGVFLLVLVLSLAAVFALQFAPPTTRAIVLMLPVAALTLHMLAQAKESTGQLIALFRLLLLVLVVGSVGWAIYVQFVLQVEIGESLSYIFSGALLLTVLALTSFLTPIHTKDAVKRSVY